MEDLKLIQELNIPMPLFGILAFTCFLVDIIIASIEDDRRCFERMKARLRDEAIQSSKITENEIIKMNTIFNQKKYYSKSKLGNLKTYPNSRISSKLMINTKKLGKQIRSNNRIMHCNRGLKVNKRESVYDFSFFYKKRAEINLLSLT